MKKRLVPVFLAVLCLTVSAVAGPHMVKPQAVFATGGPSTTNNDDTCDIAVMPAATLLLPYFEVDIANPAGETTIFTITNTTQLPQIAHITLWTDFSFPVVDFNIFLTGYDVQSINLRDVIVLGRIAPDADGTGFDVSNVGVLSGDDVNDIVFDNPVISEATCVNLPEEFPAPYVVRMQSAFTQGRVTPVGLGGPCNTAGAVHTNAIGYVTIDVAGACSTSLPTDAVYFNSEIRFDNVLIGDYMQVNSDQNFAQGNPMVHIRAIPEGGTPATRIGPAFVVNFPRTFYSRYSPLRQDARQPLPSLFAARWIDGSGAGFATTYKIWREGNTTSTTTCSAYPILGGALGITELVRFDEEENPETFAPDIVVSPPPSFEPRLPESSRTSVANQSIYPPITTGDVAGWMYMNLDTANAAGNPPASQNWVIVSMASEGRFSVDFDAAALGNGCTPETDQSEAVGGSVPIGPAPNVNPFVP